MKINLLLLVICVGLGLGWTLYSNQKTPKIAALNTAPNFTYRTLNRETAALKDHKGNVTLIHFWATWCAPCLLELPTLINLAKDQKNLIVLAIAVKDKPDAITRFLKKIKKSAPENFIIALDPDQTISKALYGTEKLPESFLLTSSHKIARKIIGAEESWNTPEWNNRIITLTASE